MKKLTFLFLMLVAFVTASVAQVDTNKMYRLKDNKSGKYLTAFNHDVHETGAFGGVGASDYTGSDEQIFIFEQSGSNYKMKTKSGYYLYAQAWNVDALSSQSTELKFTSSGSGYKMQVYNTNKGYSWYYVKNEHVPSASGYYIFGDADSSNAATWIIEEVVDVDGGYCTFSGNGQNARQRKLESFVLTDGTNNVSVSDIQNSWTSAIYADKTANVLTTTAGATIYFSELNWEGEWMHGYIFVDYNNDEMFNSTVNANGTTDGELVSYNFYSSTGNSSGTNSKGETVNNNLGVTKDNMPSFTLPSDLEAGEYRLRFNIAWNTLDACGYSDMASDNGAMVDITLVVESAVAPTPVYAVSAVANPVEAGNVTISSEEVEENGTVELNAVANAGYEFVNWTVGGVEVSAEASFTATVTAETAYVANFVAKEFTITYEVDGEVYTTDTYAYGATVDAQAEPTKVGYTFSGWSEIPATMPANDVEVTGTFAVNSYDIVYYVDGEEYTTETYAFGATVTPVAALEKEGYTFSGWSEIPATMPAENVTVTGSFEVNYYDVVYKVDGVVYATDTYPYGADVVAQAEPTKDGYTFSGWSAIPETMPAENVEVIGSFSEIIKENKEIADDNNVETADAYYANVTVADEKVWTISNNNIVADKVVVSVDTLGVAPEIVIAENGTVKAALEVKRVVKKGQWALMSFPFVVDLANVTVNGVAAVNNSNIKVMVYDAAKRANESIELWTKSGWVDLTGTTIAANQGFAVAVNAQNGDMQTVTFTAATQTYDGTAKEIALDRHASTVNEGADADWNFYGNPTLAKAQKGTGYALYVYNAEDDSYDEYAAHDVATYQPYAAWFVQSADGFEKMSFAAGQAAGALADANGVYGEMQFSLNGEDEARVLLVDEASEEYVRNEDALYFPALNANLSQLYIVKGNIKMAVSEQPALSESMTLGYKAAKAGVQTLTLTSLPENANVVLKDNVTGDEVALTVGDSYSFESAAGTFNNRFVVTTTDLTGIAQATANGDVKVVVNGDEIIVYGVEAGVEVAAYATNGVVVASAVATEGATTLATSATGVIVVKVADAAIKVIK